MKILIQWAVIPPQRWDEIDSKWWASLPQGPVPDDLDPTHIISDKKLWIHAIKVDTILFMGYDHYAVEELNNNVVVTVWNDDTGDWVGDRHAEVWEFPKKTVEAFIEHEKRRPDYKQVFSWRSFSPPANNVTRHGIWVPNHIHLQLVANQ